MQVTAFYTRRLVDPKSAAHLQQWFDENAIPNTIPPDQLHCSVITATEEIPAYRPDPVPVLIRPKEYRLTFLKEALVIAFDSPMLKRAWDRAVQMGVGLKYPKYVGHVSVSYSVPLEFELSEVKPPTFPIRLLAEESAPVTPLWFSASPTSEPVAA